MQRLVEGEREGSTVMSLDGVQVRIPHHKAVWDEDEHEEDQDRISAERDPRLNIVQTILAMCGIRLVWGCGQAGHENLMVNDILLESVASIDNQSFYIRPVGANMICPIHGAYVTDFARNCRGQWTIELSEYYPAFNT